MKFRQFLEARDHEAIIKALRAKTVERGATPAEAKAAAAKADMLEKRHNIKQTAIANKQTKRSTEHRKWTKAQWDAHMDAMERDSKR